MERVMFKPGWGWGVGWEVKCIFNLKVKIIFYLGVEGSGSCLSLEEKG